MTNRWEVDFRYTAIQASVALARRCQNDDVFDYPFSFCLPVSERPVMGWVTPDRITLLFLILGFAGLFGGAFIAAFARGSGFGLLFAAGASSLGMVCLMIPSLLHKHLARLFVGARGRALVSQSVGDDTIYCELGNSEKPSISIDGDDHVIVLLDRDNRRLKIEGIAASYQIRGEDIVSIGAFEFMGLLGADVVFRIDEQTQLRVGIAKANILRDLQSSAPFLTFLNRWIKNQVFEDVVETFGSPVRGTLVETTTR